MQKIDPIIVAGLIVAGAILANGYWTPNRYEIAAGGDAGTAWRIDRASGRVSACGLVNGGYLAFALQQSELPHDLIPDAKLPDNVFLDPKPPVKSAAPGVDEPSHAILQREVARKEQLRNIIDADDLMRRIKEHDKQRQQLRQFTTPYCSDWVAAPRVPR